MASGMHEIDNIAIVGVYNNILVRQGYDSHHRQTVT